jgi:hypothetical protein
MNNQLMLKLYEVIMLWRLAYRLESRTVHVLLCRKGPHHTVEAQVKFNVRELKLAGDA